jgi:hypothetical protein
VERNPIQESVAGYGPGVGCASAQRFAVGFSGTLDVRIGDGGKGDELNAVDLNLDRADAVPPAHFHVGAAPEPKGHGDIAGRDVPVQLLAESTGAQ